MTVNDSIYASVSDAVGSSIPAGVNGITIQFHSPTYTAPATLVGGANYARISKAAIDTAGYPTAAYFRSADRFMPDGTTDATNGGYWINVEDNPQPTQFGVVADGVTDDTVAWNAYFTAMAAFNRPINIRATLSSKIIDTVSLGAYGAVNGTVATGASIDLHNVTFQYSGTRDRVAFKLGSTALQLRQAEIHLPSVVASSTLQWPATLQTADTAIQIVNCGLSRINENYVMGFTKGIEYVGTNYAQIRARHIQDCKFGRIYTTTGTDPNASFTNENVLTGGRIACSSVANLLGSAYGQVITWDKVASYRGQNNNRFYGCTFEMAQPSGARYRTPVLFDGAGSLNVFERCRVEGAKGPTMICDGGLVSGVGAIRVAYNSFHAQFNFSGGAVQSNTIREVNGAVSNTYDGPGCNAHKWSKHDLGKLVKSAGPATSAYLKGRELFVKQGAAAPSRITTTAAAIGAHRDALMITNGTRVGVAVDTSKIKRFMFHFATQDGFPGRPAFYAFDASGNVLTGTATDDPTTFGANDWLTAGELATWGTETYVKGAASTGGLSGPGLSGGNPYSNGGDAAIGRAMWIAARDEVASVHMMVGGGTNSAVLRTLEITGFSAMNVPGEAYPTVSGTGALRVFSPVDDDGGQAKASANPATAGGHGYYQAGELLGSNAAPATGSPALWLCTTSGWLAPAWAINASYLVPGQLVSNDTGKIYQLVTPGTSASSGGPTGTTTSIGDGSCVWNYIGVKAVFATVNAS